MCVDLLGGCVGDVEEGNVDGVGYLVGHFVHGVGADEQEVGTRPLDAEGGLDHQVGGFCPAIGVLEFFDLFEVDAVQGDAGGVQTPQSEFHLFVDQAVVLDGGFPAHAAEEADNLHAVFPQR